MYTYSGFVMHNVSRRSLVDRKGYCPGKWYCLGEAKGALVILFGGRSKMLVVTDKLEKFSIIYA